MVMCITVEMYYSSAIVFVMKIGLVSSVFNFEELHSIHYGIDISDKPLLLQDPMPPDAIVLSSKYGQLYQCSYQPPPAPTDGTSGNSPASNLSVVELLAPMKQSPCLVFNKGWWTYEFCFGREVKQYHSEDSKVVGETLSLGYFENDADTASAGSDQTKSDMKHRKRKAIEPRYHKQMYVNGTQCDLTGKARSTEARFICQEGHGDYVVSIDEHETCSYVVTVHTSRICSHPQYGPLTSTQSVSITCSPLLNQHEYDSYLNDLKAKTEAQQSDVSTESPDHLQSNTDSEAVSTTREDDKENVNSKSTDTFEKLFLDSLVHGLRAAVDGQEQGQDSHIKIVDDASDLDSILKNMLLGEQSPEADADVTPTKPSETRPASSSSSSSASDSSLPSDLISDKRNDVSVEEGDDSDEDIDDEDQEFLREFDEGLNKIASTTSEKARLARYKDNIQSALSAMLPDLIHEGQEDMARQGEDAAIDAQVAFRKLAKTLNRLVERLEHAAKDLDDNDDDDKDVDDDSELVKSKEVKTESIQNEDAHTVEDSVKGPAQKMTADEVSSVTELKQSPIDEGESTSQPLASRLKDQLQQAGLKTTGRKIEFRIITSGYYDEKDGTLRSMSDGDSSAINKMIIAIIGGDDEEAKESERQQRLEENYQFKYKSSKPKP